MDCRLPRRTCGLLVITGAREWRGFASRALPPGSGRDLLQKKAWKLPLPCLFLFVVASARSGALAFRGLALRGARNLAAQSLCFEAQLAPVGAEQEGVEAALALDRADRRRREAQAHHALQRVAVEGGFLQVRQKAAPRLVVRVAHVVAGLHALAGEGATSCHVFRSHLFAVKKASGGRRETSGRGRVLLRVPGRGVKARAARRRRSSSLRWSPRSRPAADSSAARRSWCWPPGRHGRSSGWGSPGLRTWRGSWDFRRC